MKKTKHFQKRFQWLLKNFVLWLLVISCSHGYAQLKFHPPVTLFGSNYLSDIQSADLNRDGLMDIVTTNWSSPTSISIFYNNPAQPGTFAHAKDFLLPYSGERAVVYNVQIADLNKDQWPDLVVGEVNVDFLFVMLADGNGGFLPFQPYNVGNPVYSLTLSDFNNDTYPDIAFATINGIYTLIQDEQLPGTFKPVSLVWQEYHGFGPGSVISEDVNRDGYTDLVATSVNNESRIAILLGDKAYPGTFLKPVIHTAGNARLDPSYFQTISYMHNGLVNIAVSEGNNDHFAVFASTSLPGTLQPPVQTKTIGTAISIASGKFYIPDNAQLRDLVTANRDSNLISFYIPEGTPGSYRLLQNISTTSKPEKVYVNDFNGDGYDDIAVKHEYDVQVYIRDITSVRFLAPANGTVLESNVPYTLKWRRHKVENIRIRYSIDNPTAWATIYEGVSPQGDSLQWFVPSASGKTLYLEISSMDGSASHIVQPYIQRDSITVLSPNGGETLAPASDVTIHWKSNITKKITVYLIVNGTNYSFVARDLAPGTTSVNWKVPVHIASTQCRIMVADAFFDIVKDQSDADFTISPKIQLITPNGGERLYGGTNYAITWKNTHHKSYNAWYSTYNSTNWIPIFTNMPATTTSYNWLVPGTITSTYCRIRIAATDNSMTDESDANFTMIAGVKVTAPNGGEVLQGGTSINVTWNGNVLTTYNGWYTTDNGTTWSPLFSRVSGYTSTYNWTIPGAVNSTQCRIRVTSSVDNMVTDESDANFTIQSAVAGLKLSAPTKTSQAASTDLQLNPNPATNEIHLLLPARTTNEPGTVTLYNVQGIAVLKQPVAAGTYQVTIPVSQLTTGVYVVQFQSGAYTFRKTFIKK
jgi:hypothetical protein